MAVGGVDAGDGAGPGGGPDVALVVLGQGEGGVVEADAVGLEGLSQALDGGVLGGMGSEPAGLASAVGVDQCEVGGEGLDVFPPHHYGFEPAGVGGDRCRQRRVGWLVPGSRPEMAALKAGRRGQRWTRGRDALLARACSARASWRSSRACWRLMLRQLSGSRPSITPLALILLTELTAGVPVGAQSTWR